MAHVLQSESAVAPAGVLRPVGQLRQVADDVEPVAEEYLPMAQSVQVVALAAEYFPAAHVRQAAALDAPVVGL